MKDKELVTRTVKCNAHEHAPQTLYEVWDEVDPNHCLLIYSGTDKAEAIAKAKDYMKRYDIPKGCVKAYALTKQ